jgi:hypothetical protein
MPQASASAFMTADYLASQTWYSLADALPYLCTAVSGISILVALPLRGRAPAQTTGLKSSMGTSHAMSANG